MDFFVFHLEFVVVVKVFTLLLRTALQHDHPYGPDVSLKGVVGDDLCFFVEEAFEDAGAEEDAFSLDEGEVFLGEGDFPVEGVEEGPVNQFDVIFVIDEYVFQSDFSMELLLLVHVFECVDEADGDFPH